MKSVITICFLFSSILALSQTVTINPTISPALFHHGDQITVTYDVTGTSLASLTAAWVWVWIPGNTAINAKYNINPANSNSALTNNAKCTKSIVNSKTLFTITFKPSDFFTADISNQTSIGILLKGNDWPPAFPQTSDFISNFLVGSSFQTKLISPSINPLFVLNGDSISIQASASVAARFILSINDRKIDSVSSSINYSHKIVANDSLKFYKASLIVKSNSAIDTLTFSYLFSQASPTLARPQGIIDGINYNVSDQTKVTLCFWAPNKTSVYAFGDFTDWSVTPTYLMNKDGEHFWVEVTGLVPGKEYAFQYLVNDSLKIADPYTDKTLDNSDDSVIPASTYPNLKSFPQQAVNNQWYFNRLAILQTGQTPYQWQTTNYQKPPKEKLVIYELLIRDFFGSNNRSFQNLIDTISYFKKLGINAVELMPITEFNGSIGWGYNPTFMFAIEKYYGTKNKLKEFIDKCHANGIAVIMDLVMNHQDLPNSYALLDYDFVNGHPKSSNKWFNVQAPHPYSVFNDLNHESKYTQKYLDTINYHWISEYKIDGYRYDLSKGFTQTQSNESTVGNYDQSRINILERMANVLWSKFPDAYIILEHFADNSEETVLANYQIDKGRGMMLWENFNYAYNQNTMGYVSGSDISAMFYGNKGWTAPRAVGYMESHDEERLMYKNLQYGNTSGNYSVKTLSTALQRMLPAALMFYTIPGPKMLWEFGELGYDQSINTCQSGSVDNSGSCRLDPKPVLWSYLQDNDRKSIFNHVTDLIRLRKNYSVFTTTGSAQITSGASSLVQQMTLKNTPYTNLPVDSSQMNVQVVANFDVINQTATVLFPHLGTWYDYYNQGESVNITSTSFSLVLQPGAYKLYTDIPIKASAIVTEIKNVADGKDILIYPNPTNGKLHVEAGEGILNLQIRTVTGSLLSPNQIDEKTWDLSSFSAGLYLIEINTNKTVVRRKIIKN